MTIFMDGEKGGLPATEQQKAEERRQQAASGAGTGTPNYGSVTPSVVNGSGSGSDYLARAQAANPTSTPTATPTNVNDWSNRPVYYGEGRRPGGPVSADRPQATAESLIDTYGNGKNAFYGFTPDSNEYKLIAMAANAKGGYQVPSSWYEGVYEDALKASSSLYQQGIKKTPWEILSDWAAGKLPGGSDPKGSGPGPGGGGGGGGGGSFSATTRTASLTNPGTAERILDAALTNFLGRQATKSEIKIFTRQLNRQELANPSVTTQVGSSAGGATQSNVVTQGGVDATQRAEKFAESRPDYAEYQAATTYMDAFMNALSDPVNI